MTDSLKINVFVVCCRSPFRPAGGRPFKKDHRAVLRLSVAKQQKNLAVDKSQLKLTII